MIHFILPKRMLNVKGKNIVLLMLFYMFTVGCTHAGMLETTESTFGLSQSGNQDKSLSVLSSSGCGMACITLDSLGPPPDSILTIPPPPVPAFLQDALHLNKSDNEGCNMCYLFGTSYHESSDSVTRRSTKLDESWVPVLVIVGVGSAIVGALLVIFLLKCKKWKIFPTAADSCPILPESFHSHKHASSMQSKAGKTAVSSHKVKDMKEDAHKTSLKHLPRGPVQEQPLHSCNNQCLVNSSCQPCPNQEFSHPSGSPLYTELEVSPSHKYMISGGPKLGIPPYSVHTYCGVATKGMTDGSSPNMTHTLIKGCAYDNEAFLASEGSRSPVIQSRPKLISHLPSRVIIQPHEHAPVLTLPSVLHEANMQANSANEKYLDENMVKAAQTSKTEALLFNGLKMTASMTPCPDLFVRSENSKPSLIKSGEMHKRPLPPLPKDHV